MKGIYEFILSKHNEIKKLNETKELKEKEVTNIDSEIESIRSVTLPNEDDSILEKLDDILNTIKVDNTDSSVISSLSGGGAKVPNYILNKYEEKKDQSFDENYNPTDSGLEVILNLSGIYDSAANINNQTDLDLSYHQVLKTFYINRITNLINPTNHTEKIIAWIYVLLGTRSGQYYDNELINPQANGFDDDKHRSIVTLAEEVLFNDNISNIDWISNDIIIKLEANPIELLCYAISKYVNEMKQKPVLSHVADTIFILRSFNDHRSIFQMIETLNIDNFGGYYTDEYSDPDEFITDYLPFTINGNQTNHNPNNVYRITKILPSRQKFYINYCKLENIDDKRYYINKFIESYYLGLNFVGCFPKIDIESNMAHLGFDETGDLSFRHIINLEKDTVDNHGFVIRNYQAKVNLINELQEERNLRLKTLAEKAAILATDPNVEKTIKLQNEQKIMQDRLNTINDELNNLNIAVVDGDDNIHSFEKSYIELVKNNKFYILRKNKDVVGNDLLPTGIAPLDEYYGRDLSRYRLSTTVGLDNFFAESSSNINNFYKMAIYNNILGDDIDDSIYSNIYNLDKKYGDLQDIYINKYPILLTVDDLVDEYKDMIIPNVNRFNSESNSNLLTKFRSYFSNIFDFDKFDNSLEKVNSYYFFNYYFGRDDKFIIPKMNYYKIPIKRKRKVSFFYDQMNENELIDHDEPTGVVRQADIFSQDEEKNYGINLEGGAEEISGFLHHEDISNYSKYIKGILDGNVFINSYNRINLRSFGFSKNDSFLPPSVSGYLYDFYKITILKGLIENLPNIYNSIPEDDSKLKKLLEKMKDNFEISNYQDSISTIFIFSKIIEDITKRYFEELINFRANKLFSEFLTKYGDETPEASNLEELDYINNKKDSFDFTVFTSVTETDEKSEIVKLLENSSKDVLFNLFSMNEDYDDSVDVCGRSTYNDFILYSQEYSNTNLTTSLKKLSIDSDILENLLYNGAKVFIQNDENKMPIFKILNHHNYKILEKLCGTGINDFGIKYNYLGGKNYDNPLEFIKSDLKIHSTKLLNNSSTAYDILKSFSFNCYQEINLLINESDRFGYNILKNLEFSYTFVSYLINQYLCSYIHNFKNIDISGSDNFYPFFEKNIVDMPIDMSNFAIRDLRKEIKKYIDNNNRVINELLSGNTNYQKNSKMQKLDNENKSLEDIFNRLNLNVDVRKIGINPDDILSITDNYDKALLDRSINGYNGEILPFVEGFKIYLKSVDFSDPNLKLIKSVNELNIIDYENFNLGMSLGYENIFKHVSDLGEEYFKEHKYTDLNETLFEINNILIFMTRMILCSAIDLFIRKLLLKYLLQKFPNQDIIFYTGKINDVFNSILRKKSFTEILYDDIPIRLVKSCVNIYKNRQDENSYSLESVEDIYSEILGIIQTNGIIKIDEDEMIIKILKRDVLSYMSQITPSTIKNWQACCENYLRFYINQYRILKCHNILIV